MNKIAAALILVPLAGCATTATAPGESDGIGPRPASYLEAVKAKVKENFFDPYSLMDAEISQPLPANAVFDGVTPFPSSGWIVCLKANGKNRMGAYTGLQYSGFLFKDGEITLAISEPEFAVRHHCEGAKFKVFEIA